jgi:hypothetical protein
VKVQKEVPIVEPGDSPQGGDGPKLPELSLTRFTTPVGVVGLVEESVTVMVQVVVVPTFTDPGLQMMEVVVECAVDGVVTERLNLPLDVPGCIASPG